MMQEHQIKKKDTDVRKHVLYIEIKLESLILAQNERWRQA